MASSEKEGQETSSSAENVKKDESSPLKCDASPRFAHSMGKQFVKETLNDPGSAEFPSYSDREVVVKELEDCKYKIVSYVRAKNVYGG